MGYTNLIAPNFFKMIGTDKLLRPNVKIVGEETEHGTLWLVKSMEKLSGRVSLVFDEMQLKSLIDINITAELIKEREIYNKAEENMKLFSGQGAGVRLPGIEEEEKCRILPGVP